MFSLVLHLINKGKEALMQKERLEFPQRQISRKRFTNLFLGRNLEFSLGALKQEISTQAISLATQSTTD